MKSTYRIQELIIQEGFSRKVFAFSRSTTLITSDGSNSVGKTTLIRALLFSLGEEVPGTQEFKMSNKLFVIKMANESGNLLRITRTNNSLVITENGTDDRYTLPFDLPDVKNRLWGLDNSYLANNSLGTCYIDQDKGWSLLNRGKAIGNIHFSIEELLKGLSGSDFSSIEYEIERIQAKIKKYEFAMKAVGYRNALLGDRVNIEESENRAKDRERLAQLNIRQSQIKHQIRAIRKAQKDNQRFVEYVKSLKLQVEAPDGTQILVTHENLVGYKDNESFMDAEVLSLRADLSDIDKKILLLSSALKSNNSLLSSEQVIDSLDYQLSTIAIDGAVFEKALLSLKKQRKELQDQVKEILSSGHSGYDFIAKTVYEYCRRLGVEEYYSKDNLGILTSDLKSKSGTYYSLLVFAFRLAFYKAIMHFCNAEIPLIIDSPRGREMNEDNFQKCMNLLNEEFFDKQVIIASICSENIHYDSLIYIESYVMEGAEIIKLEEMN